MLQFADQCGSMLLYGLCPGWGNSSNFQYPGSGHVQVWTQLDLRFCENEVSKRFKINEKGAQLDRKLRKKFLQNA